MTELHATIQSDSELNANISGSTAIDAGLDSLIALGVTSWNGHSGDVTYTPPVQSVNGKTGNVQIYVPDAYTKTEVDELLSRYVEPDDLADVAVTGDYSDLIHKPAIPTVPTKVSAFVNDAGYLTQHQSLEDYATKEWVGEQGYITNAPVSSVNGQTGDVSLPIPTVPANVSAFNNDAGYLTQHQSLTGYATESWVGQQGYLTQHQDLSDYATVSYVDNLVGNIEDLLEAL